MVKGGSEFSRWVLVVVAVMDGLKEGMGRGTKAIVAIQQQMTSVH